MTPQLSPRVAAPDLPLPGDRAAEKSALDWLFRLADQERGVGWNPSASADEQWKLGRTRALLDLDGAPDRRMRCVLVAGTKGKGSTAALLASILAAAGVPTGLYTKPHLQSFRERIRVDGEAIAPGAFAAAVERARQVVARLMERYPEAGEPTTFEVTTALALGYFESRGCEVAVVEVGMGGRLDATNALDPQVSVITSISRDHTAILGPTLGAIAAEKAGIMRAGRAALLAEQRPSAARALRAACRRTEAACRVAPPLEGVPGNSGDGGALAQPGQGVMVSSNAYGSPQCAHLVLAGAHQRQNAALAVAAARELALLGVPVDDAAIVRGLELARWPGRFEVVTRDPAIVLDGAHNDASALALGETLDVYLAGRPLYLVLGINRDKDARAVLRPLLARARGVWTATARGSIRALPAERLARLCRRLAPLRVEACASVEEAVVAARLAAGSTGVVCATGSFGIVGQARAALGLPPPERLWDGPVRHTGRSRGS